MVRVRLARRNRPIDIRQRPANKDPAIMAATMVMKSVSPSRIKAGANAYSATNDGVGGE